MILSTGMVRVVTVDAHGLVDGDTLRVRDAAVDAWGAPLARLQRSASGEVRLRLAGIDAPESHYPAGPPGLQAQSATACARAEARLRALLDRAEQGALLIQVLGVDRYGRALVLAWPAAGQTDGAQSWPAAGQADGAEAWPAAEQTDAGLASAPQAHPAPLADSLNAALLADGSCYPDLHDTLPEAAVQVLARCAARAREAGCGLWPEDRTASGVDWQDLRSLGDQGLVLPRLFRRLADFHRIRGSGDDGLEFREFLEQRERMVCLRDRGLTRPFADCVEISPGRCRIEDHVENFLYLSCLTAQKLT